MFHMDLIECNVFCMHEEQAHREVTRGESCHMHHDASLCPLSHSRLTHTHTRSPSPSLSLFRVLI